MMSVTTNQPASWGNLEYVVISLGILAWIPALVSAVLDICLATSSLANWVYVNLHLIEVLPSLFSRTSYFQLYFTWGWHIGEGIVELILVFVYVLKTFVPKCKAKDWQFLATEPSFGPKVPKMLLFAILLEIFSQYFFGGVLVIVVMIFIYTKAPVTNPWKAATSQPAIAATTQQPMQKPPASTVQPTSSVQTARSAQTAQRPAQKPAASMQQSARSAQTAPPPAQKPPALVQKPARSTQTTQRPAQRPAAQAQKPANIAKPTQNISTTSKQAVTKPTVAAVPSTSVSPRTRSVAAPATQGSQAVSSTKVREVPIARIFDGIDKTGISGKIVLMTDGVVFTTGKKETFSYPINDIAKVTPGAKASIFDLEMKNGDKRSFKLIGAQEWERLLNDQLSTNAASATQIAQPVIEQQNLQPKPKTAPSEQDVGMKQLADAIELARMAKLKKLVKVSERLKVSQMAQILNMDEATLYDRIVDWAAEYGFTLDEDVVKFSGGRKDDFINSLGDAFSDREKKPSTDYEKSE